jgi:hypothetical protein
LADEAVTIGVLPCTAIGNATSHSALKNGPTMASTLSLKMSLRVRLMASEFSPRVS